MLSAYFLSKVPYHFQNFELSGLNSNDKFDSLIEGYFQSALPLVSTFLQYILNVQLRHHYPVFTYSTSLNGFEQFWS